jgi:hypothetical protein
MVRPKPIPRRNCIHAHARLQTLSHDPCFDLIGPPLLAIGPYLHPVVPAKLYRSRQRETPAQYPSETESQLRRKLGRCCPGNAYLEVQSIGEFSKVIAVSLTSPTGTGEARNASLIVRGPSFLPKPDLEQGWPRRSAASRNRSFIVQQFPSNRDRSIIFLQDYSSLLCLAVLILPKLFNDI